MNVGGGLTIYKGGVRTAYKMAAVLLLGGGGRENIE